MKQEPSPCKMCHHGTQHPEHSSAPTASRQSSQTGGAGLEHSSNSHQPTPTRIPPPSHHYVRVSCLKAMRSIWKRRKCLLGHNAESLQRKCCACCFAQRHGCVCLQWSRPPRAVLLVEEREVERVREGEEERGRETCEDNDTICIPQL